MPTLKPTPKFKFLPHRTFSPKAFWLSHIAAHLQARTSQHSNQRLAKELQSPAPHVLIEIVVVNSIRNNNENFVM